MGIKNPGFRSFTDWDPGFLSACRFLYPPGGFLQSAQQRRRPANPFIKVFFWPVRHIHAEAFLTERSILPSSVLQARIH